jgi:hypothetical protein
LSDGYTVRADIGEAARPQRLTRQLIRLWCAFALLLAGGVHVDVGLDHLGSSFGALSLTIGVAQVTLAAVVSFRPSALVLHLVVVANLVLIQLYALNVTVGLPPVIAHTHVAGTRDVWGLTLAAPNQVDAQGLAVLVNEIVAAACAGTLGRAATGLRAPR